MSEFDKGATAIRPSLWQVLTLSQASPNVRGMALMTVSTICQALMHAMLRLVPGDLHPFEVAFFRNFFGVVILLLCYNRHIADCLRTRNVKLHVLRGTLNVIAMLMFFHAVLITPLADVAALGFTAPLFASAMAIVVLRERLRIYRVAAMAVGLIGAVTILRPGFAASYEGPVMLLVSSAIWAATMLVIKVLARTESSTTITLYMGLVMAPISGLAASFYWQWPDGDQLIVLVGIACLGTLGQVCLAQAFRMAEVSAVLPLDFLKLVWGSMLGFFIFAESVDVFTWLGGMMIFGSTTWQTLRESRSGRKPAPMTVPVNPATTSTGETATTR